jgi:predicted Zn-dependent protease
LYCVLSGLFYNLGRQLGRKAIPAARKTKLIYNGLAGTEEESLQAEIALGKELAAELRETLRPYPEAAAQAHRAEITRRVAGCLRDKTRAFSVELFEDAVPNAIALPGGLLFLSDSLLSFCNKQPEELAFVVGHEMAHVVRKHTWDRLINETALRVASALTSRLGMLGTWVRQEGLMLLRSAHAKRCELEADELAFRLAAAAGYGTEGAFAFLARIGRQQSRETLGPYMSSHPNPAERIATLRKLAQSLAASGNKSP